MSDTLLKTRLEEAASKIVRCGLCTDLTATSYCLPCDTFVCNNCLPLLHEDEMDTSTSHRIHIITRRPTLANGPKAVERRITPPTDSYAKAAVTHPPPTSNTNRTPTSNIKGTSSSSLEEKSQSTYRPISIASALQPASASPSASATSPRPRPITRAHELARFRLFACLSSASCRLFPHFITYNAHNDATTTNTLLDHILTTCDEDVDEAISIAQRLHAGGYSFDQSEELVDAIAYIHDENVAQRMNANPQLKIPVAKVVAQSEATAATVPAPPSTSKATIPIPIHPHQRPRFIVPATVNVPLYERVRTGGVLMEMSTPNNGDCALYAIILAALMPHLYNPSAFDHICAQLVDPSMYAPTHFADLRRCFTEYLQGGGLSSILTSYIQLTQFLFFMRMKMCQQLRANGDALLVGLEQPDAYVEKMSNPGEWLDHRELSALSLILQAPIHITAIDTPVLIIHTHLHVIDVEKGTHNALVLHYTAGDSESNQSQCMTCHNHYTAMVCDPRIVRDLEREKQYAEALAKEEMRRVERQETKEEEKAIEEIKEIEKQEQVHGDDGKDGEGWLKKGLKQQRRKAAEKAEREADIASILEQQRAQAAALAKQKQEQKMMEEKTTTATTTPATSHVEQKQETVAEATVSTPAVENKSDGHQAGAITITTHTTTTSTSPSPSPSPSLDDDRIIPIPGTSSILISCTSTSPSTCTPDSPHPSAEWEHVDGSVSVSPTLNATPTIDLLEHMNIVDHYAVPHAATTSISTSTSTSTSTSCAPAPAPAPLMATSLELEPGDGEDDDWETVAG